MSLRDYLEHAVLKAFVLTALIAGIAYAWPAPTHDPNAIRQQSGNTVLYDHKDTCWTGQAPADVDVPGHVVIRIDNPRIHGERWFYGGKSFVKTALIDVFQTDILNVHVAAFCR